MNELVKVEAADYGLEEIKAEQIKQSFMPKIAEREGLAKVYAGIITKEINFDTCEEARECRLKLVKVRTGIASVHKAEKSFFLAAGKFVDAWKNRETLPVSQMEEKLMEIENHYEIQEQKRLDKLQNERVEILSEFVDDAKERTLFTLSEEEFEDLITVKKMQKTKREDEVRLAEEERKEEDRKLKVYNHRRDEMVYFGEFASKYLPELNINTSDEDYKKMYDSSKKAKSKYDDDVAKAKADNERLKKEKEANEKREAKLRARNEKREAELNPYIAFVSDYSTLLHSDEEAYQKEFDDIKKGAESQWEYEVEKQKEIAEKEKKEQLTRDREDEIKLLWQYVHKDHKPLNEYDDIEWECFITKIKAAKKNDDDQKMRDRIKYDQEQKKLKDELRAKEEAEKRENKRIEDEKKEKEATERKANLAPEKEKVQKWIDSIELPEISIDDFTEEGKAVVNVIRTKFNGFKKWAESQKESIK